MKPSAFFEAQTVSVNRDSKIANGNVVRFSFDGKNCEVFENTGDEHETNILNQLVTHAGPYTASKRKKVIWFEDATIMEKPFWHELVWFCPQLLGHLKVVVVQEDEVILMNSKS